MSLLITFIITCYHLSIILSFSLFPCCFTLITSLSYLFAYCLSLLLTFITARYCLSTTSSLPLFSLFLLLHFKCPSYTFLSSRLITFFHLTRLQSFHSYQLLICLLFISTYYFYHYSLLSFYYFIVFTTSFVLVVPLRMSFVHFLISLHSFVSPGSNYFTHLSIGSLFIPTYYFYYLLLLIIIFLLS